MGPSAGDVVASSVRLERRLAEGGMGNVWVGHHLSLHTQVVVKFMHESLVKDAVARERFAKEAVAASQVKSPHVVQTFDHGVTDTGLPFIVMELLEGEDLAAFLDRRGRLTLVEVASIVVQVGRALARAHERGVVHRDIKPENIFLCDQGGDEPFVKLLDFGIARMGSALTSSTLGGATMGTPFYMSPEQFLSSRSIDYRTDLWSLGVVAFEAAVGVRPFDAESLSALAIAVHSGPTPIPSQYDPELAVIDGWFQRACARDPRARFTSAKDMADALTLIVTGEPEGPLATLRASRMERPRAERRATPREPSTPGSADTLNPSRTTADAAMVRGGSIEPSPPRPLWVLSAIATVSIIGGLSMAIGIKTWLDERSSVAESTSFAGYPSAPQPPARASGSTAAFSSVMPSAEEAKLPPVATAATAIAAALSDESPASVASNANSDDQNLKALSGSTGRSRKTAPAVTVKAPGVRPLSSVAPGSVSGSLRGAPVVKKPKATTPKRENKEEDIE